MFDLDTLGFIQIREEGGRGSGFRTVKEYPLVSVAGQYPEVVETLRKRVNVLKDLLVPSPYERVKEEILKRLEGS